MSELTDAELLRLAADGSREALGQIARRYAGFVYSIALRHVHDRHRAEDVTQAVFVILSQKISRLDRGTLLHGWFFTTTRYVAANATKMHKRRMRHERIAAEQRIEVVDFAAPDAASGILDEAMASLRQLDRCAVLLSYFGGRTWREVGEAMGTTEEAARKRVERAIERMRSFLARRGLALSGAGVAGALEKLGNSSGAPAALVESVVSSLAGAEVAAAELASGALPLMLMTKLKIAAALVLISLGTLAIGGAVMHKQGQADQQARQDSKPVVVELQDVTVEFLGISAVGSADDVWWNPDGSRVAEPPIEKDGFDEMSHQLVLHVAGPNVDNMGLRWQFPSGDGMATRTSQGMPHLTQIGLNAKPDQHTTSLRLEIAGGEWETIIKQNAAGVQAGSHVVFGEAVDQEGRCVISVSDDLIDQQSRVIAIGQDGSQHEPIRLTMGMTMTFRQLTVRFDLPVAEIDRFEFQARPFDQWVQFNNVSLAPGRNAGFQLDSGRIDPKASPSDGKK